MRGLPTIEFLTFCLQQAPGVGDATLRSVLKRISEEGLSAAKFLQLSDQTIQSHYRLKLPAIAALRHPEPDTSETWERMLADFVKVLVFGQPGYPPQLQNLLRGKVPPILFALGNLDLFQLPAVGFCGSRKASDKGLQVASECARLLAQQRINVVSGYAHGVDLAAHRAALESGGTTTLVLAEGIRHFRLKEEIRDVVGEGDLSRILVVSEFSPDLPWRAHNAMTRNRTICGLARALIVIESGLKGGTFEAGITALELGEPLFCVEYADPAPSATGNAFFLQQGAFNLKRSRDGQPNLSKLLSFVRNGGRVDYPPGGQAVMLLKEKAES